jgi:hypothetical protein
MYPFLPFVLFDKIQTAGKHQELFFPDIRLHSSDFSAKSQGSDPFNKMCVPSKDLKDRFGQMQTSSEIQNWCASLNIIW